MREAIKGKNPTYIDLSISTGKTKNEIKNYNKWRKRIEVDIKEEPSSNKANKELISFLSKKLDLSKSKIKITKGKRSSKKTIQLKGIKKEELVDKIRKQLN